MGNFVKAILRDSEGNVLDRSEGYNMECMTLVESLRNPSNGIDESITGGYMGTYCIGNLDIGAIAVSDNTSPVTPSGRVFPGNLLGMTSTKMSNLANSKGVVS